MAASRGIFIVGAKRTAFGALGGKLLHKSSTELAVHASKAAMAAGDVAAETVDAVFMGNVIQSSLDAPYLARHVGLQSGVPVPAPALTVNRLCGSGFEAVIQGAEAIELDGAQVTLCGGTESMSQAPMVVNGKDARFGVNLGVGLKLEDALWAGLTDSNIGLPMGITAENLAERYNISREDCDEYAARSQIEWGRANSEGIYQAEIAPMTLKSKKGETVFDTDEHPRPEVNMEKMAKLPTVFKKGGVVTAGGASGICDGAASLIVASEDACQRHNLTPLARIVSWKRVGCDPEVMGIGPVGAIQGALANAGDVSLDDVDLVEINEAFAAQYLACEKELGLDRARANRNGGAIALGHPLGASGARIMTHLSHELVRTGAKRAVGAACIGGGQGIAIVLEGMSA